MKTEGWTKKNVSYKVDAESWIGSSMFIYCTREKQGLITIGVCEYFTASDQHLISPDNINTLSSRQVRRKTKLILS